MNPVSLLHQDVVLAARSILGWTLVSNGGEVPTSGIIVETEAYRAIDDPAAHAYRGQTVRNRPMYQDGGTIYVYLSYGLHTMLNLVTGRPGEAEAILIRAVEPVTGIETMIRRRGTDHLTNLTSGPAKLTQAMGVGLTETGTLLGESIQLIAPKREIPNSEVTITTRIGISRGKDLPWRFYLSGSPYVSRH